VGRCAVACTPSTYTSAPASWASFAIAATSGRVPIALLAAVTATTRVRGPIRSANRATGNSPVAGSNSAHRTVAPARSAACVHGRTLASWSSRETITSSPGPQAAASVRATR
jgi:hypothetical protein